MESIPSIASKPKIMEVDQSRFVLVEERLEENGDIVMEIQEIEESDHNDTKTMESIRKSSVAESSADEGSSTAADQTDFVTLKWTSSNKDSAKSSQATKRLKKVI